MRIALLALLVHASPALADTPRCGPGMRCGPPPELVHGSVHTVVTTTIDGVVVRAVAGRDFVTVETLDGLKVSKRTAVRFEGATGDVSDVVWNKDRLVFHVGHSICLLDRGAGVANCVVARGHARG